MLDRDLLTIPDEEIHLVTPQLTMLDGKIVYLHTDFANEYNLKPAGALITTYQDLLKKRPARVLGVDSGG